MFQETMGDRIKQKREKLNLSQEALGKELGNVTHASISKWENNQSQPQASNLVQLSKIFNCSIEWLILGSGVDDFQDDDFHIKKIHLIDDVNILNSTFSKNKNYLLTERTDISIKSFACKIKDNSMLPIFLNGDVVLIDPNRQPETDCFVLARIADTLFIRKFITNEMVNDKQHFSIVPINQDYTIFSTANKEIEILGIVVEHRSKRMR